MKKRNKYIEWLKQDKNNPLEFFEKENKKNDIINTDNNNNNDDEINKRVSVIEPNFSNNINNNFNESEEKNGCFNNKKNNNVIKKKISRVDLISPVNKKDEKYKYQNIDIIKSIDKFHGEINKIELNFISHKDLILNSITYD